MARLYEMCNEIDSEDILLDREELTDEEKARLFSAMEAEGVIRKRQQRSSGNTEKNAKENTKRKQKRNSKRYVAGIAVAAALAIIITPNVSANAAYAMSQIPILGNVIKMITVREYNYDSERFEAKIKEALGSSSKRSLSQLILFIGFGRHVVDIGSDDQDIRHGVLVDVFGN